MWTAEVDIKPEYIVLYLYQHVHRERAAWFYRRKGNFVLPVYALLWSTKAYPNAGEFAVQLVGSSFVLFTSPGLCFRLYTERRGRNLMRRTHSALGMPVAADTFWSSTWNVYGLCLCVEFAFFVITLEAVS